MRSTLIACLVLASCVRPVVADDAASADVKRLSSEPGVAVAHSVQNGLPITTWTKAGVTLEERGDGPSATFIGSDRSGKGAVVCNWSIYVETRAALEMCPAPNDASIKGDLDGMISKIDAFIVANAFVPLRIEELRAQEAARYDKARQIRQANPATADRLCSTGVAPQLITALSRLSEEERQKTVADLLSIPRWPVMNPCL